MYITDREIVNKTLHVFQHIIHFPKTKKYVNI